MLIVLVGVKSYVINSPIAGIVVDVNDAIVCAAFSPVDTIVLHVGLLEMISDKLIGVTISRCLSDALFFKRFTSNAVSPTAIFLDEMNCFMALSSNRFAVRL